MHGWHTRVSPNLLELENEFDGYEHNSDDGYEVARGIRFINKEFKDESTAAEAAGNASYGSDYAVCFPVLGKKKKSKAYEKALSDYIKTKTEYSQFMKKFSFALDKKAAFITCPVCKSKINSEEATRRRFTYCPVCGTFTIMPDATNKKKLKQEQAVKKAATKLSEAAAKCEITFVARLEWHE